MPHYPRRAARSDGDAHDPEGLPAHVALLVAIGTAALAACAKLAEDVFDHEPGTLDDDARRWALARQTPAARAAFLVVARVGAPSVVIPSALLAAAWLRRERHLPIAAAMVTAPAVAAGLFVGAKHVYDRPRPAGGAPMGHHTHSFPSGHATTAAAVFGTAAYILWREDELSGPAAVALATAPPAAIGASRVYLDVHWATDVLAGWSAGALVAALGAAVYERARRTTRDRGRPGRR